MKALTLPSQAIVLSPEVIAEEIRKDPHLRSKHTTTQYKSHIARFDTWREGRDLTVSLVNEYLAEMQREQYAVKTIQQHHATIRWCARKIMDFVQDNLPDTDENRRTVEQAARVATMRGVEDEGETPSRGRHLGEDEFRLLLDACDRDPSPAGARDKAILWVAWSNGLRRQTLCDLDLANLEKTKESAEIRYISKRRKHGTARLFGDAWTAMQAWLAVRGSDPGPIFARVNKSGKVIIPEKPLTVGAVHKWLKIRFLESGLSKSLTWHTFRYTFAGNLIDEGYDITTVQDLMLHASPTTTSRYDKRKERHQAEAILSISNLGGNHA